MAPAEPIGTLIELLRAGGEDLGLVTDRDLCAAYATDASRIVEARPQLVIRPRTTQGVSRVLALCRAAGVSLVVQGGRTGLSGGARVQSGEVVLSLERLRDIGEVDALAGQVEVGAGAVLEKVQAVAQGAGLQFGVDLGARGTATIGGMIATNAGGIRVLRHGMMRANVVGIEAVLADGTVLSDMRGLDKNNAGLSLVQLLTGSEGTLAVVTRARLRLTPRPDISQVALCAVATPDAAMHLLEVLRPLLGPALSAFEGIWPEVYAGASTLAGARPLACGAGLYLLIEMQGQGGWLRPEALETAMMAALEDGLVEDVVLSQSGREEQAIWQIREACTEHTFSLGRMQPHDLSLPARHMAEFLSAAERCVAEVDAAATIMIYGHLGDGNLHYLVKTDCAAQVSARLNGLAASMGGSITAEHGVGLDKRAYLPLVAGQAELDAMRRLKMAFDPEGQLNPGRLLPPASG